jgi:Ca-activated chloride channel family protein
MNRMITSVIVILAAALTALTAAAAAAQKEDAEDRTLSPYFFIDSDDPDVDRLPLQSTEAEVTISGVIADVTVTQTYKNEGKTPLEAVYIFPASTRAAVYGMKMTIGERVIHAKIRRREEAREEYEQARKQGRNASLLEQQRPNVFQMNVANIMPGDVIKTELRYTELLVPTGKTYEFVYPTVVGPRYSNRPENTAPPSEQWVRNPYLHQAEAPDYTFDISVRLAAGLPIQKIFCASHNVNVSYEGTSTAKIRLDASEAHGGNRDYVLQYRLAGKQIESGLLLYEGQEENYFLLMLQPPERVTDNDIPGREYIFVVDVSGSMHGFPLDISKRLLRDLIGGLRPGDTFNVLLFAGGSSMLSERSLAATPANINHAIHVIGSQRGGGGTELLPALHKALSLPKEEGYSRTIVIATDGYVTVEEEAFDLIRNNLGNANMFAFGIGTSVNRHIIEGMAAVGMGEPFIITRPEEAAGKANAFRTMIQSPVLTGVNIDFGTFDTYDVEPVSIPDVLAERPVIVFGKWRGSQHGMITMSGISGNSRWEDTLDTGTVSPLSDNAALRYLWARHRIKLLSDYNMLRSDDSRIQEVTGLGLRYNLLTAYTSFVAVDTMVRNKKGNMTAVRQPLPLPQGVSDYAVGTAAARAGTLSKLRRLSPGSVSEEFAGEPVAQKRETSFNLKIDSIHVAGDLSKDDVLKVVRKHLQDIWACCGKAQVSGFTIQFKISSRGRVKEVKVRPGKSVDGRSVSCIVKQITKWRFPAGQEKEPETIVTVTFTT